MRPTLEAPDRHLVLGVDDQHIGAALVDLDRLLGHDERLLPAFEVEQECREPVYAARFLPRWRYAPMAALEALMR